MTCLCRVGFVVVMVVFLGSASASMAADATQGRALYQQYCSVCHGPQGKGNGPAAAAMQPRPRDHTDGAYMNALSAQHLIKVLEGGGPAVNRSPLMPAWKGQLTTEQMHDVIAFLRSLAVPPYTP